MRPAAPRAAQAIIYVVDSTDRDRIGISREEFHSLLSEDELAEALILVYANKQASAVQKPEPCMMQVVLWWTQCSGVITRTSLIGVMHAACCWQLGVWDVFNELACALAQEPARGAVRCRGGGGLGAAANKEPGLVHLQNISCEGRWPLRG